MNIDFNGCLNAMFTCKSSPSQNRLFRSVRNFEVSAFVHIALRLFLWPVSANQLLVLDNKHAVVAGCFVF